ncbi:hypothetical protein F4810DRAFT_349408 [Camillea tinctor]|nr:hypothetical protein F4810DRAFT_349408 [Camillea tinctor]
MARGALKPPSKLGDLQSEEFANKPKKKVTFVSPDLSRSSSTTTTSDEDDSSDGEDASTYDIDSTCGEAGSDNEALERDDMATTDSSEAPEWSREEDRAVVSMKIEGKTWADIGKELSRGKKEVQRRYKTLSSDAQKLGLTVEKLGQIWAEESEEEEEESEKRGKAKKDSKKKKKEKPKETSTSKGKDKGKQKPAKSTTPSSSSSSKKSAAAKPSEGTNSKSKKKRKPAAAVEQPPPSSEDDNDGDVSSSSSSSSSEDEEEDPVSEHWAQQRYLYHEVFGAMYPNQRPLRPDAHWSADDCRTLAVLEARRRQLWWQYLQSDFYNATGRVVDAELLRAKFEEDCGEEGEDEDEEE